MTIKSYTQAERDHLEDFGRPAEYDLVKCAGCEAVKATEDAVECENCKAILCSECMIDHQCGE